MYIEKDFLHQPHRRGAWFPGRWILIKNDILAAYMRCYSNIPPFQRPGCTEYVLCRAEDGLRVIVRTQHMAEEQVHVAQYALRSTDETTARRLLQFLYENAVSVENVCDILQDLFSADGAQGIQGRPAARTLL